MIDNETKEKIIELWKKIGNKSEISKIIGVSVPTIRKIIREHEDNHGQISCLEEIHVFKIKTTQHFPMSGVPLFQALERGTAFRFIETSLSQLFGRKNASKISRDIQSFGERGEFQVSIRKDREKQIIQVTPW